MLEVVCAHLLSARKHDDYYQEIRRRSYLAAQAYAACKQVEINHGKAL